MTKFSSKLFFVTHLHRTHRIETKAFDELVHLQSPTQSLHPTRNASVSACSFLIPDHFLPRYPHSKLMLVGCKQMCRHSELLYSANKRIRVLTINFRFKVAIAP